jgi:hypothetical protein
MPSYHPIQVRVTLEINIPPYPKVDKKMFYAELPPYPSEANFQINLPPLSERGQE